MPGFTHLQKAQPITLAHHMGAYFEMFKRDRLRLHDIYERMNYCPLGSGALAGTTYPLDREYTAELLGFYGPTLNSMDGVSDRDYLIEFLSACATIMKRMTSISIILMVPTLIASFYGMNVPIYGENMPHGFAIIVMISITLSALSFFIFRKIKWF